MDRIQSISDPVLRYSLTIEIIHSLFSFSSEFLRGGLESTADVKRAELDDATEKLAHLEQADDPNQRDIDSTRREIASLERAIELYGQADDLSTGLLENVDKHLTGITDWISQPIYSPDHPHGESLMRKSQSDCDEKISDGKVDTADSEHDM